LKNCTEAVVKGDGTSSNSHTTGVIGMWRGPTRAAG